MDTKLKTKLKHYGTGLALLVVLTFVSCTSNSEFVKVRSWAVSALHMSSTNSSQITDAQEKLDEAQAQIDENAAKIEQLENDLRKQNGELAAIKQQVPAKVHPPKSYPKPPADWKPMEPKKHHSWWPF